MTFSKKIIEVTITLGKGEFGEDVGDTVTFSGLRTLVYISNCGGDQMGQLEARIWGLSSERMNKLTTIGPVNTAIRAQNKIAIAAGDEGNLRLVYQGSIDVAFADLSAAPESCFVVHAFAGLDVQVKPVGATSIRGGAGAADIMQKLATDNGLGFENMGVSSVLTNPYFSGSPRQQILACARAAKIQAVIDKGVLRIFPGTNPQVKAIPVISAKTGLRGYPAFSSMGVDFVTQFNPDITIPGVVKMESELLPACGEWTVYNVSHELACEMQGGPWWTHVKSCARAE